MEVTLPEEALLEVPLPEEALNGGHFSLRGPIGGPSTDQRKLLFWLTVPNYAPSCVMVMYKCTSFSVFQT